MTSNTPHITEEHVQKLADLARIELESGEAKALTADLKDILGYVEELQSVGTTSGEMEHGSEVENMLREDVVTNTPGVFTEAILGEVPARENNFVKVRKVLE